MSRESVLVVEDDEDILELVRYNLQKDGYRVRCEVSGEDGVAAARAEVPDLIVLDLMLPGIDGLEVCRRLRQDPRTDRIPVVIVTAKGEEADVVVGLELGADDYVTKPFSPRVLLARLKAVMRRVGRETVDEQAVLRLGDLVIDPVRHQAEVQGHPIDLTLTEFRILAFLARRPGWVFTRTQIVETVRGEDYPVTDRSVDVHIVALRRKLGACAAQIETVRGVGYRFRE